MAERSLETAELAMNAGDWRSSVSRAYYAAYQATTALLLSMGETPPMVEGIQRESWAHETTPGMLRENLRTLVRNRARRLRLSGDLASLYRLRVDADYVSEAEVGRSQAASARRDAGLIVRTARFVLKGD